MAFGARTGSTVRGGGADNAVRGFASTSTGVGGNLVTRGFRSGAAHWLVSRGFGIGSGSPGVAVVPPAGYMLAHGGPAATLAHGGPAATLTARTGPVAVLTREGRNG